MWTKIHWLLCWVLTVCYHLAETKEPSKKIHKGGQIPQERREISEEGDSRRDSAYDLWRVRAGVFVIVIWLQFIGGLLYHVFVDRL